MRIFQNGSKIYGCEGVRRWMIGMGRELFNIIHISPYFQCVVMKWVKFIRRRAIIVYY